MFKYCKYCKFLFPISALFWGKVFGNVFCFIFQRKINTNVYVLRKISNIEWVVGVLVISFPESEIDDNFFFVFIGNLVHRGQGTGGTSFWEPGHVERAGRVYGLV